MTPLSTKRAKGRTLSPSSTPSSPSSPTLPPSTFPLRNIASSRSTSPKRHSSELSTNMSPTRSNAIPRGNGHQAMSVPMPPPPPLYFSLLPPGERGERGGGGGGGTGGSNGGNTSAGSNGNNHPSNNTSKKSIWPSKNPGHSTPAVSSTSLNAFANHSSSSSNTKKPNSKTPRSAPTSRPSSTPPTPGWGVTGTGDRDYYHTHHHAPRSTYPLSVTHSRRSSISHVHGATAAPDQHQKAGFFDMAIFDPAPQHLPKSARASAEYDMHRRTISRPPSIESINSANSVPFAPPLPPPPSAWKRFVNHFSHRVIKRHIKFIVALYISSAMALIPPVARALGSAPYLANVAVVFMHPARTVGAQLEVTVFCVVGAVLAALWILPCQVAVAAFNQKYLPEGNNSAWAIDAVWFFLGVWIMTTCKAKYAKLNCAFIIYTITGIFALTKGHTSTHFQFSDFWNLVGPMMLGVAICLAVSILLWPETASEGLGRALNESLDTSRALLNLSTRSFLLNHKTIALPKSAIEKSQSEVRIAQKKLYSAYREARYEVNYSMTNPTDYKEVRVIVSALMRHLGSMSLVVQNERLLMLGHPDRDDEDLLTRSGDESSYYSTSTDSETSDDSESDSDSEYPLEQRSENTTGDKIHQQGDYFGSTTPEDPLRDDDDHGRSRRQKQGHFKGNPIHEDGHSTPRKRVQRRSSAAELRRIRQLLQRADNTAQAAIKTRQQQHHQSVQEEDPQQSSQSGHKTNPSTPGGRGVFSVFGHHQTHHSKASSIRADSENAMEIIRPKTATARNSVATSTSSRPSSIHEEQNLDTVKSFKSLFSVRSKSAFKPNRPSSLKAGFKIGHQSKQQDKLNGFPIASQSDEGLFGDGGLGDDPKRSLSLFRAPLTGRQVKKEAEAYRKRREKEEKREKRLAEQETKAEQRRIKRQEQSEAAARAVPPKEVAFGDRKLFMSFLDIVRDPLQRLSDSCSRVMVAMERELVSGLSVEQDRLERIRRRNIQRADAIRAAEANLAEEEKAAVNEATANANTDGARATDRRRSMKPDPDRGTILNRLRVLIGIGSHKMTQEDIDYAEALKSGLGKEGKRTNVSKRGLAADAIHPNKFLRQDAERNAFSSGIEDDEEDFILPPDMSYVQYLTQELEVFDKAEAEGLRDFIATHPTLDVGPREEIFLIFFFLFALREIARELLHLGKYVEELEAKEQQKMEEEGRSKRRKQLWWPKVIGNFWRWFAWGSYSQVKTSEGYNSLIMNTTKNLEHRQAGTIEEEKAHVEAKAAKAAVAAEATAKSAAEKELQDMPPLRRSVTLSTLVHRRKQDPDLEQGEGGEHHHQWHRQWRGLRRRSQEPRSRSNSPGILMSRARNRDTRDTKDGKDTDHGISANNSSWPPKADGSLITKDVLNQGFGQEEVGSPSSKATHAGQYAVVEIPHFESLQRKGAADSKHSEDINLADLAPHANVVKPLSTAPSELDVTEAGKSKMSRQATNSSGSHDVVFSAPSSAHQDRYPSFASSTSPAFFSGLHESDSTAVDNDHPGARRRVSREYALDDDSKSSMESDTSSAKGHDDHHDTDQRDGKSRFRIIFAALSRHPSETASEPVARQRQEQPVPEPTKPQRTIFVSVDKPKTWRYRFWEALQPLKSEEFKFGFKMAVALSFIALWSWLQWESVPLATDRGQWAMMTVMAVLSPTVGATFKVCLMRIAGTLAGTLWALLTYLALPGNPYVICSMMLLIALAAAFLILESPHPPLGIIMLLSYSSITFIMYEGNAGETIYQICYQRAATVIIGIIIAVIMNSLLWPILARRELRKEIAFLIGRQGVLFAELVNKFLLQDPWDQKQGEMPYVAGWPQKNLDNQDEDSSDEEDVLAKEALETDQFQDSFVEHAEREAHSDQRQQALQSKGKSKSNEQESVSSGSSNKDGEVDANSFPHPTEASQTPVDPDRLAFQLVEHQLQTKLIKISQLLELSGSEPKLKEDFPMELYKQIIQCCQNILDRLVSMRMAVQLLSPDVRELVTGPMNYYRRDMVGALLLYFSVLSSSLASKSPLPPYLPSARMARLRVIYNAREIIAAHQAVTGEDHYTYIYYYAFSSALEEVIEELELLAILIKPLVGVTLVSSGKCLAFGPPGDQLQLGPAMATSQLGLPPLPTPAQDESGLKSSYFGNVSGDAVSFVKAPPMMTKIGSSAKGAGTVAEGGQSQYPHNLLHRQRRLLEQSQAQQQQLQLQLEAQQELIQQQQLLLQQQQLGKAGVLINPQITPVPTTNLVNAKTTLASRASLSSGNSSGSSRHGRRKSRKESRRSRVKVKTGNHQTQVVPDAPSGPSSAKGHTVDGTDARIARAATMPTSPILMMNENLLGSRHGQRYKEALQAAQEASGQQVIEVLPPAAAVPAQIQIAKGATSSGSGGSKPHNGNVQVARRQSKKPLAEVIPPFNAAELETLDGNNRPRLVASGSANSVNNGANIHQHRQQTSHMPSTPAVPAVVVTPFGSELIPEAPLPLYKIPIQTVQTKASAQGDDLPGEASHHRHPHHQPQHSP